MSDPMKTLIPAPARPDNEAVWEPVAEGDKENRLVVRNQIDQFEEWLKGFCSEVVGDPAGEMESINDDGLKEYFLSDGVYIRELYIPAETAVVTQLWKRERFWIIAYGDVTFRSELGVQRIKGPHRQYAPYGSKVVLWTHEPTLWFAISATDEPNTDGIKSDVIAADYGECRYEWEEDACPGEQ